MPALINEMGMMKYGILPLYFSLSFLILVFLLQVWKKDWLIKHLKKIFVLVIILVVAYFTYFSYLQYQAFQLGVMRYIFETPTGWQYFLSYTRMNIFGSYLVSLIAALGFLGLAIFFNKKFNERFFEPEEPYLGALAIFLIGYPGWLFYLGILIMIYLINHLLMLKKGTLVVQRLSLRYLWLPTAILVSLIINFWLISFEWWTAFKF